MVAMPAFLPRCVSIPSRYPLYTAPGSCVILWNVTTSPGLQGGSTNWLPSRMTDSLPDLCEFWINWFIFLNLNIEIHGYFLNLQRHWHHTAHCCCDGILHNHHTGVPSGHPKDRTPAHPRFHHTADSQESDSVNHTHPHGLAECQNKACHALKDWVHPLHGVTHNHDAGIAS